MNEKNKKIIDCFKLLSKHYECNGLKWKKRAIDKAIKILNKYNDVIISGAHAKQLDNIGEGIAKRIDEIIQTNTLVELKTIETKESLALHDFCRITGVGPSKANKWINDDKLYSIDDLKNAIANDKIKVTHHIEIGLKYLNDFEQKIPRPKIELFEILLKKTIKSFKDKNIMFEICGSYRRGLKSSGDVDILLSHQHDKNYLKKLVTRLTNIGCIIDNLTSLGDKKYMGVYMIDKIARRIDIRFIERKSYYTAMLYFTGSKDFNIKMRNIALKKGYSLSEYHLRNVETSEDIFLNSEKELFDILKKKYVKPTERIP
jgi:DNA polymerase beta|tara:strand:+ start:1764 stop:2711 length:948 start_codon:yes stop_codon:yes gene_type:complete